jgi:hypothetical protein
MAVNRERDEREREIEVLMVKRAAAKQEGERRLRGGVFRRAPA